MNFIKNNLYDARTYLSSPESTKSNKASIEIFNFEGDVQIAGTFLKNQDHIISGITTHLISIFPYDHIVLM